MSPHALDTTAIEIRAARMRRDIVEMLAAAGSGHPGGSLSAAEIVATLFFGVMRHDPRDPDDPTRDRFVLSKGHAAPVLYAALAEAGYFGREHLVTLRTLGSLLQGHPDSKKTPGVEVSTGSLGQGLSVACGIALGLSPGPDDDRSVYCLLGDGECQEGQVWEAAMFAAHKGAGNLVAIVDHNGLQIDGACSEVMCLGDIGAKFAAFGWEVASCDGHDVAAIADGLARVRRIPDRPGVLIARTIKGKGVSFMEGEAGWHGKAPSAEETEIALGEIAAALEAKGVSL